MPELALPDGNETPLQAVRGLLTTARNRAYPLVHPRRARA